MEKETMGNFNLEKENNNETLRYGFSLDYFNNIPGFMIKNDDFIRSWMYQVAAEGIKNYSQYFEGKEIIELSNKKIVQEIDRLVAELIQIAKEAVDLKDDAEEKEEAFENFKIKVMEIYNYLPRS